MSRALVLVVPGVLAILAGCDAGAKPAPPAALPPPPPHVTVASVPPVPPVPPMPPPTTAPLEHVLLASIDRGACYGTCPIYTVTVYRDGKVEYVGKEYVKKKGKVASTVTAEQLAALDKLFTDNHYLAYKDAYDNEDATDAPSARTAYVPLGANTTKFVRHYYGDMHAPESLTNLEESFDTIVKSERWIGTEAERDKLSGR
jgi:hypothetical protein